MHLLDFFALELQVKIAIPKYGIKNVCVFVCCRYVCM